MKGTLRIVTVKGKLSAELDGESITLIQEAENYLKDKHTWLKRTDISNQVIELSGKDLDCFYVDDVQLGIVKDERVKVLHLKPTVTPDESDALWNRIFSMLGLSSHSLSYKSLNDTKDLIKQNFHITKK